MSCNPEISPIVAEIEILSILFKYLDFKGKKKNQKGKS
jgi:hypothetical protein